ncbi:hypothetical protein BALCAV_0212370 [Alkalihalobacillus alcalophilus ATCC 27647 = CGMCC 1.3604]|uniref:Uncharacterized protein n=1 Tax=Alkalihalobacillus alcalophilus ATCC 27647 = CGMCC 1.3604 TaxID=1218173 RepID=A0A094WH53_ALKAL|nr:hypothetical protein BALCAV_0212370 [Alkalihalobacillus alcalophilus ATCC 27647 = CGMCC 1.3604]
MVATKQKPDMGVIYVLLVSCPSAIAPKQTLRVLAENLMSLLSVSRLRGLIGRFIPAGVSVSVCPLDNRIESRFGSPHGIKKQTILQNTVA